MLVNANDAIAAQMAKLLCRDNGRGTELDDMAERTGRMWDG